MSKEKKKSTINKTTNLTSNLLSFPLNITTMSDSSCTSMTTSCNSKISILDIMKRSKCLLSTIHSVKILKHITGSTTRNVKNFETHCGLYNPQFKIISKMNCRLYNPQCVSKNFTLRAVELAIRFLKFLHCRLYNLQYILKKFVFLHCGLYNPQYI